MENTEDLEKAIDNLTDAVLFVGYQTQSRTQSEKDYIAEFRKFQEAASGRKKQSPFD